MDRVREFLGKWGVPREKQKKTTGSLRWIYKPKLSADYISIDENDKVELYVHHDGQEIQWSGNLSDLLDCVAKAEFFDRYVEVLPALSKEYTKKWGSRV